MTYNLDKTSASVQSNLLYQVAGTITDFDTWLQSGFPATYVSHPNDATGWQYLLNSGSLANILDGNGNPVANPSVAHIGTGSNKSTFTIKARVVTTSTIYVDTFTPVDTGGAFRPPAPQHIWDGTGNQQTVYVTVSP